MSLDNWLQNLEPEDLVLVEKYPPNSYITPMRFISFFRGNAILAELGGGSAPVSSHPIDHLRPAYLEDIV